MMKKIMVFVMVVMVLVCGVVTAKLIFDANYFVGYYYEKGEAFDTGMAKGFNWYPTGAKAVYSRTELKELAQDGIRISWQAFNGVDALGFTFSDNLAMLVPGLGVQDHITDHYYLTF